MKIDRNFIWIWGYDLCNLRFKPYLNLCHLFLQIFYSYWKQIFSRFKQIDYKIDSSKQIGKRPQSIYDVWALKLLMSPECKCRKTSFWMTPCHNFYNLVQNFRTLNISEKRFTFSYIKVLVFFPKTYAVLDTYQFKNWLLTVINWTIKSWQAFFSFGFIPVTLGIIENES